MEKLPDSTPLLPMWTNIDRHLRKLTFAIWDILHGKTNLGYLRIVLTNTMPAQHVVHVMTFTKTWK